MLKVQHFDKVFLTILLASINIRAGVIDDGTHFIGNAQPVTTGPAVTGIDNWNYDDPNAWLKEAPDCGKEHQSPINIDTSTVIPDQDMPRLTFVNYDKVFPETVTNNGHTIMLKFKKVQGDDLPYIKDGGLGDTYIFEQLHFHWGGDDSRGSEHWFDGLQFPAELHIVHYNQKYGSFKKALNHEDGLAVLAVLIETEKRDNTVFRHIEHFEAILNPDGSPVSELPSPITLEDLIPDNPNSFFRYIGSLTTPSCNQVVSWTVFFTPIAISERQLAKFRQLFDPAGHQLVDNFRPVQTLNDRQVFYRFEEQ